MSRVRVCFLGTPEIAKICLQAIHEDPRFEIAGVITQPDRPAGRKLELTPCATKKYARENDLKVISPESVNKDPVLAEVAALRAEVAIVVAFGQILSGRFLELFPLGAVNVHGSLLPRWRGAAPIQRAIEAGDTESGVCLQKIVKELDAGDLIGSRRVALDDTITAKELYALVAQLGCDLLRTEFLDYVHGSIAPRAQDPALATYAKKIDKAESLIDWAQSTVKIHDKVRAFNMGPGTYTLYQGQKIKIHQTQKIDSLNYRWSADDRPGAIFCDRENLLVKTGTGTLRVLEIQPESRARMPVAEFLKSFLAKTKNGRDQFE